MSYLLFFSRKKLSQSEIQLKLTNRGIETLTSDEMCSYGIFCVRIQTLKKLDRNSLFGFRSELTGEKIDIIQIPSLIPKLTPSLCVFDMDSTVIKEEVIDELARIHGVFEEVSSVTKQAMDGGLNFDEALKLRVKYLKGLSIKGFQTVAENLNLNEGMNEIFANLPTFGCKVGILSGGFTPILELFTKKYPVDFFRANFLIHENGIFTGEIKGEIINREKKEFYFNQAIERFFIPQNHSIAVGDGANDSDMINAASIGIGFHAKDGLKAKIENWIDFVGMQSILFIFQ